MILWIVNYLTNRSQFVRLGSCTSETIVSNTGAPQGTVMSPFLFCIYTADCRSSNDMCPLIKFADDTALIGLISNDDDSMFLNVVQNFTKYCKESFLELNVSKTKEMIVNFHKAPVLPPPVVIEGSAVERVDKYKYLGIVVNNKLDWSSHIDYLMDKLSPRLYCLRKLNSFNVNSKILSTFYQSVIQSVFSYCIACWGGYVFEHDRRKIDSVIGKGTKVTGLCCQSMDSVYDSRVRRRFEIVLGDTSHPLHGEFSERIISRSGRLRTPTVSTNRYKLSFVPRAIALFNDSFKR